jgi:penicillin-binding protein 1A
MAAKRKTAGERREPVFDASPAAQLDLRLEPGDRPGGAPARQKEPATAKREGKPSRARKADNDDIRKTANRRRATATKRGNGGGKGGGGVFLRRSAYWIAVLALWAGIGVLGMVLWVGAHLPPIQSLEVPKRPPSVQIVDANGAPLATRGEMGGASVPLKELPKFLPEAFLAIEDRRFYSHFGIDPFGVARAVAANVWRGGVAQGGSTLTQQLAKNVFLTQERTFERKVQELLLAFWLEHKFSKAQILELYVNRVYFGAGAYGVEAAAQRYFGKSARAVTLAEAALLAGLVRSPSRLAPTRNPEGARRRAAVVLTAMREAGFISEATAQAAIGKPAQIARVGGAGSVNYVADWVMDILDDLVGRYEEDLVVETTIDSKLQATAEQALVESLDAKGEKLDVEQGALIAMTPAGAVRALVGGRNYAESQFNRAIAAKRQPGSAFKPFVYLAAIERGMTPETLRDDRPINVRGWRPENFTRNYAGAVPLSRALAQSLNTVAVRLALEVSPKAVTQTAHRLGIASKLEANASIALGTSEVSMLEMVSAFAPFANGGEAIIPYVVARVRAAKGQAKGQVKYTHAGGTLGRVIDPVYVGMMNRMLRETLVSGTARSADLPHWRAAGKTGTSQDFRDAWFIGYTPHLVTAVWLGNDDSSATRKSSGSGLPVDIWSRVMKAAHQGATPADLPGVNQLPPPLPAPAFPNPFAPSPEVASRSGTTGQIPSATASRGPIPPGSISSAPIPPAAIPTGSTDARRQPPRETQSLDRWLLDTVFGRR